MIPEAATADLYSEGVRQFRAGGFQIAEAYFRAVIAQSPGDLPALMGLAASYDRLGLFERADEVYAEATRIGGPTAQTLNNQGYSMLLRGDISGAREMFLEAYRLAPGQQAIKNNLVLLAASSHLLESGPSAGD